MQASFSFRFHVVEGSGAYICGEETSLLNSLEGLRPGGAYPSALPCRLRPLRQCPRC
ncbi:MAG: hypothetical protein MZV63_52530 [Marinilabiliales bacterium]|nr:hypothetical protein [Marinilabiliales bacterium]